MVAEEDLRGLSVVYMRQNAHVSDIMLPSLTCHQLVGADPACHGGYLLPAQPEGRLGGRQRDLTGCRRST